MFTLSNPVRLCLLALAASQLAACGAADRLANVGQAPALSAISSPTEAAGYRPVQMPMPAPQPVVYNDNSLWRSGERAFFRDQRARQVGDLLTVNVVISDRAEFDNQTRRRRSSNDNMGMPALAGFQTNIVKNFLPDGASADKLIETSSQSASAGEGSVERSEALRTNVAAVVTQRLPNGNLVIEGRQEVRVNFEVRELIVAGVVRPEDIASDNTIDSRKIAEARISYGGRGQLTDVQQPRYGQQVLDILLPF